MGEPSCLRSAQWRMLAPKERRALTIPPVVVDTCHDRFTGAGPCRCLRGASAHRALPAADPAVPLSDVVTKAVRSSAEVIGVQSEAAPAAYRSWRAGTLVEDTTSTFAEGLATRTAFELPQRILRDLLDDFVLVSEDALRAATRLMIEKTRNLVEPAGAAALAAVLAAPGRFAGRKVAIICSGGNISPAQLAGLWPPETA